MRNTEIPQGNSLRRFFAGLAEHVFESRLGLADPPLVACHGPTLREPKNQARPGELTTPGLRETPFEP